MNQLPETRVNVSVRAYTRWYSSNLSPLVTILSDSRCELFLYCYHVEFVVCIEDCGMGIVV